MGVTVQDQHHAVPGHLIEPLAGRRHVRTDHDRPPGRLQRQVAVDPALHADPVVGREQKRLVAHHHEVAAAVVEAVVGGPADPLVVVGAGEAEAAVRQPVHEPRAPHLAPLAGARAVQQIVGVVGAESGQDRRRRGVGHAPVGAQLSRRAVIGQIAGGKHEGRRSTAVPPVALDRGDRCGKLVGVGHAVAGLQPRCLVVRRHVRVGDMSEGETVPGARRVGLEREVRGQFLTGAGLPADEGQATPATRSRPVSVGRGDRQVAVHLRPELQLERAVGGRPRDQLTVGDRYPRQSARAIAHAAGGECVVQWVAAGPSVRPFV